MVKAQTPEAQINVAHLYVGGEQQGRADAANDKMILELVTRLTKESFDEHLNKLLDGIKTIMMPALFVIGTITTALVAIIVWLFLTLVGSVKELNGSVNKLEITVSGADKSIAAMQGQLKENKDGLSKLEERMYRRDGSVR